MDWRPRCALDVMHERAEMLIAVRQFFQQRAVLEVETPLLCHATGTDPQLDFFSTRFNDPPDNPRLFLQTSPEFAMKRLLAAGSGCIYQICKAFRNSESGRFHNPEFTILEWYRLDFTLQDLMQEVAELFEHLVLPRRALQILPPISYQDIFQQTTGLDPLVFDLPMWQAFVRRENLHEAIEICVEDHGVWLDFIFSHVVQPKMKAGCLYRVYHYPALQSALARIHPENPRLAERFEVFVDGVELGNGFRELTDADEQAQRFDREVAWRRQHGLPEVEKDRRFLAALQAGLPECSGIAIGLDRLLMILLNKTSIDEALTFPVTRA